VWFYYIAGTPKKKKGLKNFVKNKLGKPPVLIVDATPERTAKVLTGQLQNEGYFKSKAYAEVKTKKKQGKIVYTIDLYPPYVLRKIYYPVAGDSAYTAIINLVKHKSILKTGQRYQLSKLQSETERIEMEVENYGFYYFDDKHRIFPDYTLASDTTAAQPDTLSINGFTYFSRKHNFRPAIITRAISIMPGHTYSRQAQQQTISHLMDLGVFKFVSMRFTDVTNATDFALLDNDIYLTPLKKKSLRAEFQTVSKSNNFIGPGLSLMFTNRNFLKGAELFQLKLSSSYEVQVSKQISGALNSFELMFESSLSVPRLIAPFSIDYSTRNHLPKTVFRLAVDLQNRVSYFRLNSFNARFGYHWFETPSKTHALYPIDINFLKTDKTSPSFEALLSKNPLLSNSFQDQFIIGSRYTYALNTQLRETPFQSSGEGKRYKEHSFYFNGNVDVAGNLFHTIQKQAGHSEQEPLLLLGSPYSQYVLASSDSRYYYQPDVHTKLVLRLAIGVGYAYGNSTSLPYIKQFAMGGANSIRAFPARSVGPGTYYARQDTAQQMGAFFIDQRGDIKLEGNLEYRFDIYSAVKGALFVDTGNIWLWKEDADRPGAKFIQHNLFKELAVRTGAGLRFDFNFFVLRLDVAFPLRKPFLPDGKRWVFDKINFSSSSWRGDNIIFNIAIGYPF